MKILLIEDDPEAAEFEQLIFREHEITLVSNLHEALTAQMKVEMQKLTMASAYKPFEVIILDLRLPNPYPPPDYHDAEEVMSVVNEKFPNIPVFVISAFLTSEAKVNAIKYGMAYAEKIDLKDTDEFRHEFDKGVEVSKHMRRTGFHHMTVGALEAAMSSTHQLKPYDDGVDDGRVDYMTRVKARCYLGACCVLFFMPVAMLLFSMYSKAYLHDNTPIPYYAETLFFCGICISAILGITPWILKFFTGVAGVAGSMADQDNNKK